LTFQARVAGAHANPRAGNTRPERDQLHFNRLNQYLHCWPAGVDYGIYHDDNFNQDWQFPGNGVTMGEGWITASYNALNQPVAIWSFTYQGTPNFMWLGYDPLGRCVKRWVGDIYSNPATYFHYDGWNLLQEGNNAWGPARAYAHGNRVDEIVWSYNTFTGEQAYLHYDARGHCTLLTDSTGNILEQYEYDAFGQPYFYDASGNSIGAFDAQGLWAGYSVFGNRFLFTGREWLSDVKLYDYRNRMYQPELGRFLQPDSKQFEAGDYNLYRYCHNDPVNKGDPMGLVENILEDFQWRNARFFDSANTGQGSLAEMDGTQRFLASVRDFTHKERPDASRVDAQKIGRTAVADAKEDAEKVELRDSGRWGIEQATGEYVNGAELVKAGPEPGQPYKFTPTANIPKPPAELEGKVALIGTHGHGPQSGMKAELQKLDEASAKGAFTKGVPYISAVGSSVDKGARIQIYVPHYGYFNSKDGVTFSVGK
jgi:RHS repeat-associated protein